MRKRGPRAARVVRGLVISAALAPLGACGHGTSPATAPPVDASSEPAPEEAATTTPDDAAMTALDVGADPYDRTTGQPCQKDADCRPSGGPGVNRCSNDGTALPGGQLFPTPVCVVPAGAAGNCDPGDGTAPVFCDGAPDNPSSPGVCVPLGSAGAGHGLCLPRCRFAADGSAASGCQGKDACWSTGFVEQDSGAGALAGIGYCLGGCDTDADCQGGQQCQAGEGLCVDAAVSADGGDAGAEAQFCVTGRAECAAGSVCDAALPVAVPQPGADAALAGWTQQNPGMAGSCAQECGGDAGPCSTPGTTCRNDTAAGPDCRP